MAYCSKCGSVTEPGDAFCASCGAGTPDARAATRAEGAVPASPPSSSFTTSRPVETQRDPVAPRRPLKHRRIVLAAVPILLVIIVIAVASGGGGSSAAGGRGASAVGGRAASSSPGATDTNSADAAACSHLAPDARQLIADNGDAVSSIGDLGAIEGDLSGVEGTDGGSDGDPTGNSDMSQSLATAFNALDDDVSGGGTSNMTAASVTADAQAMVSGCASAGVSLPAGFASAVSAGAMSQAAG
jgi:hypothetical protein